ncbi:hypothetical protein J6590_069566 [Homalodisca vitripennis]|nr:hypothetical protein J6590_069566 [Homalodisca vitripennis]
MPSCNDTTDPLVTPCSLVARGTQPKVETLRVRRQQAQMQERRGSFHQEDRGHPVQHEGVLKALQERGCSVLYWRRNNFH